MMEKVHWWTARLVKNGPLVGIKTFWAGPWVDGEEQDRSPRWQCLIGSEITARAILMGDNVPVEVDGAFIRNVTPTTEANYSYLCAHAAYSTAHATANADASPTEAIDFNKFVPF